ncbi:MAG: hypothetical protein SFV15_21700 [Polyangiaceae bacterium]|nr:hypothetical protein [Polyangiaceae bacterium]
MKTDKNSLLAAACVLVASLSACESIIGIEDRELADAKTLQRQNATPQCLQYCEEVISSCTGKFQVYSGMETCLGVCALLEAGDSIEPAGNTVACRLDQARKAVTTGELNVYCESAGPGGGKACGTNCASYCSLLAKTCPEQAAGVVDCPAKCLALRDATATDDSLGFDATKNHDTDTLQCRLVHVSSATVNAEGHCPHATITPTPPCVDDPLTTPPACADYCQIVTVACTGADAVYESVSQCLQTCTKLTVGQLDHKTENTVGCRKYHAYNSLLDPKTHCSHAGPTGDGHCGKDTDASFANCESYCQLAAGACPTEFGQKYADAAACLSECFGMPATFNAKKDSGYTTASAASGNTLQCRVLHTTRVLADKSAALCPAVFGGAPCN